MKNRTKKIFVGGVPTTMPEETIRTYFVQFGEVRGGGGGGGGGLGSAVDATLPKAVVSQVTALQRRLQGEGGPTMEA